MERMTVLTGVRMTPSQAQKLAQLAKNMRMPKNRLMGLLIDSAEAQALPAVSVRLEKNNRCDAQELSRQSIATVGA